jgi:hypothetical protein
MDGTEKLIGRKAVRRANNDANKKTRLKAAFLREKTSDTIPISPFWGLEIGMVSPIIRD